MKRPLPECITQAQVAKALGICRQRVWKAINDWNAAHKEAIIKTPPVLAGKRRIDRESFMAAYQLMCELTPELKVVSAERKTAKRQRNSKAKPKAKVLTVRGSARA